ncbi:MAG: hypothetical protein GX220_06885 [Treponema sp.]|nr:hypothetical protein [Treponema sp.]
MAGIQPELARGVKTFFVVPDTSLVPEEFLEDFSMNGYETYFINDDQTCRLEWKIETLFNSFEHVILFFNIDRKIPGIEWTIFIKKIQDTYGMRATIGVTYLKKNADRSRALERIFLYDIGIFGGCIQLEYNKNINFQILNAVLIANQANSQRKNLRAICGPLCKLDMIYKNNTCKGVLRDVSISHFSCVFPAGDPPFLPNVRIDDILLNLHGIRCKVSAVLCINRAMNGNLIHVFAFLDPNGNLGLETRTRQKVNKFVYSKLSTEMMEYLQNEFVCIANERKNT